MLGACFALIDADWGIMDQLATHSAGYLGFE
jgi:hypothetical protein